MNLIKRLFKKKPIEWIIVNIEEDGTLSEQDRYGKHKLLNPKVDGPRDFELVMEDNKIIMRWVSGNAHPYQIEVENGGTYHLYFENAEPIHIGSISDKLVPKEDFVWYKMVINEDGSRTAVPDAIPPEKLDCTYEFYLVVFYFVKMCINMEYVKGGMSPTGCFYVNYPGSMKLKGLFARLLAVSYSQFPDWMIQFREENFNSSNLKTLDKHREQYSHFLNRMYKNACREMSDNSLIEEGVCFYSSCIQNRIDHCHSEKTYVLGEKFLKALEEYSSKKMYKCRKKAYVLVQTGSNPSYNRSIVTVCFSIEKAIELLENKYEIYIERYKPTEKRIEIDGASSRFEISDAKYNAWIRMEIDEKYINE